jgi:hypothetical protein
MVKFYQASKKQKLFGFDAYGKRVPRVPFQPKKASIPFVPKEIRK